MEMEHRDGADESKLIKLFPTTTRKKKDEEEEEEKP